MIHSATYKIDLNCDMGEGMPTDEAIMPFISSTNIACGYHAGDEKIIQKTIALCLQHKVAIGAHPGFADKENFGRTTMQLSEEELYTIFTDQVLLIKSIAEKLGGTLHHVKPHGALYNMAAKNKMYAHTLLKATKAVDADLIFYGLSNSLMITEAEQFNVKTASEVFADRTYQDDGSLTPRSEANALITDIATTARQALQIIQHGNVTSINNVSIRIKADTICIHGDGEHAVSFAKAIFEQLQQNGIRIETI